MCTRLYSIMNLTWGYVETILNLSIQMRIEPTKILVRKIRNLKREYDKFRWGHIDESFERKETQIAESFEEAFSSDFDKLFHGLEHEVNKLDLTKDHKLLVIAVQQALTLMDTVKLYAEHCDAVIAGYGVWTSNYCMVQTEFLQLYPLIPQFAGDCYQPDLSTRRVAARILANRLKEYKL